MLQVEALANGDVAPRLSPTNPITNGELTKEEIEKGEADEAYRLVMLKNDLPKAKVRSKGPKYTPVSKRGDKPDAIAHLLKFHPEISDAQIVRLIGTTKNTITKIREKTHENISNIKPRHPADLGLCTYGELEKASEKGIKAGGVPLPKVEMEAQPELEPQAALPEDQAQSASTFDFSNFMSDTRTGTDAE